MTKKEYFEVTEGVFTVALILFFIFWEHNTTPDYLSNIIKEGILYTIIDKILYGIASLCAFAAICLVWYSNSKIKKVFWAFSMFNAIVTCEVLHLPLMEFAEDGLFRLKEIYPYYFIALLIWSSVYIIDYFVDRYNKKGEA